MRFKIVLILALIIVSAALVFPVRAESEEPPAEEVNVLVKKGRTEDPLNLKSGTVASNYFLGNHSLSGLTLAEAQNEIIEILNRLSDTNFVIQSAYRGEFRYGGFPSDLGITYDLERAMQSVREAVQEGSLLERYMKAKDYQIEYGEVKADLSFDEEKIMDYYNYVLPYWNCQPENAFISYVNGGIAVTRGKVGVQFDFSRAFEQMFEDIRSLDYETAEDGCYYLQIDETPTDPELTYAKACELTVLGSYTTHFFAPTTEALANRMQNLMNSAAHMNGSTFAPGEQAKALTMYGSVTEENGYKMAGTINESAHTMEIGGGICQTTTTLYNAVLMAELQVDFRNNHSMMVVYVDPSRDAMVHAASGQDFKFTNNTSNYICVGAWVDQANYTITVTIFGHEEQGPGHQVRYESEVLELQVPPISYIEDRTKALGWNNVTTKVTLHGTDGPTCGVKSRLWKVVSEDGVDVSRTLVGDVDTYKPSGAVYDIAPDALCRATTNGPREAGFVAFEYTFLDGVTPLGANPALWTAEQLNHFNNVMYNLCAAKGCAWPDGPGVPETQPAPPETEPAPPEEDPGWWENPGEGGW